MRVLHFLHPEGTKGGDPFNHVYNLAMVQADSGHEVGIVYLDEGAPLNHDKIAKAKKFCALGIKHERIDPRNAFRKTWAILAAYREATQYAQKQSPELVHGHGDNAGFLAHFVQKNAKPKRARCISVHSPHGLPTHFDKSHWPQQVAQKLFAGVGKQGSCNGIIFDSAYSHQAYLQRFGPPDCASRLIYEGLGPEEFAPRQIIDMATDFMFVGEMNHDMGIDTLIQALGRMKKSHTTGALIIGSGPGEQDLRAQVDRYGLSHQIFFNAPLGAKTAFLKGGCLVLPARVSSIPTIALRAAAAGVPMILSNAGGLAEMIGDVKIPLIAPNDTDALQEQLVAYLENPKLFLGRAALLKKRIATHFTLERMFEQTEQFYQNLLNGKG